jgi:hypothetical protein
MTEEINNQQENEQTPGFDPYDQLYELFKRDRRNNDEETELTDECDCPKFIFRWKCSLCKTLNNCVANNQILKVVDNNIVGAGDCNGCLIEPDSKQSDIIKPKRKYIKKIN